jgi:AcrR family transcriptional regulator
MAGYQRARSVERKEERRNTILDVARELAETTAYADITMDAVARGAGLGKSTLYGYFETKEELFIALVDMEFAKWFADVSATVAGITDFKEMSARICSTILERQTLMGLLAMLHPVIEHGIDRETALRYKTLFLERSTVTARALETAMPFLGPGGGMHFLVLLHALVIGLTHMSNPSPVCAGVLADPQFAAIRVTFEKPLALGVSILLAGFAVTATARAQHAATTTSAPTPTKKRRKSS